MNQIDLPPGDYVEASSKPLDKPSRLYWAMLFFALMSLLGTYLAWLHHSFWYGLLVLPFAALFGVGLAGRFPALFFRRDH